jgi:hypothetical protein
VTPRAGYLSVRVWYSIEPYRLRRYGSRRPMSAIRLNISSIRVVPISTISPYRFIAYQSRSYMRHTLVRHVPFSFSCAHSVVKPSSYQLTFVYHPQTSTPSHFSLAFVGTVATILPIVVRWRYLLPCLFQFIS